MSETDRPLREQLDDGVWPRPKNPFRPIFDAVFFLGEGPEVTLTFDELEGGATNVTS